MTRLWNFITSLRLTVVCLALGILLVFLGTIAQVNEGLWNAQARWFKSFFIWWGPQGADWKIPIMPGGYTIGCVLLANLVAAHIKRFQFTTKKLGIHLTHCGVVLLLVGQLVTDMFQVESVVMLREGETKNYSESQRLVELVFAADAGEGQEKVVAIPEALVTRKGEQITPPELPFSIRVKEYGVNCEVRQRAPVADTEPPLATQGAGPRIAVIRQPEVKSMDARNMPFAVVEILHAGNSLGTWLVTPQLNAQEIKIGDQTWRAALRFERYYKPFSVHLIKATHEIYRGTDIPKNFQSRVRIENARTGENREVDIYMNNPLRYEGLTFYQYQMGRDELDQNVDKGMFSSLQVVRNPGWLTPYVGCVLVGIGLVYQFLLHLIGFVTKRRVAPVPAPVPA
ncbi:MAG: cytochrome c biogenesis protein ResB [Verrucomicrobiota bacterium]|nr:cytochrome c biogenesis protein ResB [Verrucomicrobiota bacterium]